jgi:transcriptional regulator with XRE-family HTH domain
MKHVGETIKTIIEGKHLQKNLIASQVGITPTYLSSIMHKATIDCGLLERICRAIGVHPRYFFEETSNISYNVSDVKAESVVGTATVNISQGEVDALQKLIDEKERTIQILMRSKGFNPE